MTHTKTIILAAGGTGGHLFPAEAVARILSARGHNVHLFTDMRGQNYAANFPATIHVLPAATLGGGVIGKVKSIITILRATFIARKKLKALNPHAVLGFGGYPSFAPVLAAGLLGLPIIMHEQGSKLGLANRLLLRFAKTLAISFPKVAGTDNFSSKKIFYTGNPVRREIIAMRERGYKTPAAHGAVYLLITGGSQGAQIFADVVPEALLNLSPDLCERLIVSLQYRGDDAAIKQAALEAVGIKATLQPFFTDMPERLADAHLVVARGGASTIAELLVAGRPAIIVPYPHGHVQIEQTNNAAALQSAGAAWLLPQADLSPQKLAEDLQNLLQNPERLALAAAAARTLGKPDAAETLAELAVAEPA